MISSTPLKPQYGWSVAVLLPVIPRIANVFIRRKISANTVSWLSLLVFLIGLAAYALFPEFLAARIFAVLCFVLGTLLDVADGYVARMSGEAGKSGAYLDAIIDLFRYNIFLAVLLVTKVDGAATVALVLYAFLLNASFYRLFRNIHLNRKSAPANATLGAVLPVWYRNFCIKNRLLFNPFNLEDQLLIFMFVISVLFGAEVFVLWLCLFARIGEVAVVVLTSLRRFLPR